MNSLKSESSDGRVTLTNHIALTPDLQVIVPNLHWRYSGVTATNRMIAPLLAKRLNVAWLGRDAPDGIARMTWRDLFALRVRQPRKPVIWHARRNNEMMVGLVAESARLAAQADLHLGRPAPSHLDHALADFANGCGDRRERSGGVLSEASRRP